MHPVALFHIFFNHYLLIFSVPTKNGLKQQTTMSPLGAPAIGLLLNNKIF